MQQRQLKFRCWNIEKKYWLDSTEFYVDGRGSIWFWAIEEDEYWEDTIDNFIVNQWTGLTDKNGYDLFEGDIVKIYDKNEFFTIEFKEGSFCLYNLKNGFLFGIIGVGDCEIIGNIFENPELLNRE